MPGVRTIDQEMQELMAIYRRVADAAESAPCLLAECLYA
jgi:hypothetical protein